jgi:DNA-binding NtrC family response regulator
MSKHNILLVDDEGLVLGSLKRCLRGEDYRSYTAANAWEALGLLDKVPFAVAVCDLAMPDMDGHRLLSIMRERHPQVVRVVLTGLPDQDSAVRAINDGEIFRFLTKPWDDDELRDVILDALERYEAGQHLGPHSPKGPSRVGRSGAGEP